VVAGGLFGMNWSLFVPSTPRALFDAAVDEAKPIGGAPDCDGDISLAREQMKAIGKRITSQYISAHAGGTYSHGESFHVDVFGDHVAIDTPEFN
jgi:hypothetical protein